MSGYKFNSCLIVNLKQLDENINALSRSLADGTRLIPVLKTDAFGLGLIPIAKLCSEHTNIDTFATAQIGEGIALRQSGINRELLVMGGCPSFLFKDAAENNLTIAIGYPGMIETLAFIAKNTGNRINAEIKIETGLNRIGIKPGREMESLIGKIKEHSGNICISGAFSHFADPGDRERTKWQYDQFMKGVVQLKTAGIELKRIHICGSEAYELYPEYALDAVRIGRALYMDNPNTPTGRVKEVATWMSFITNLRNIKAGETLGYGAKYRVKKDCLVATVGVGYGDGLNEHLVEKNSPVLVNGKLASLIGCCMDQCQIDVSGIECGLDDKVIFFGYDENGNFLSSQRIAGLIGNNEGCGLTSALGVRVERKYIH